MRDEMELPPDSNGHLACGDQGPMPNVPLHLIIFSFSVFISYTHFESDQ